MISPLCIQASRAVIIGIYLCFLPSVKKILRWSLSASKSSQWLEKSLVWVAHVKKGISWNTYLVHCNLTISNDFVLAAHLSNRSSFKKRPKKQENEHQMLTVWSHCFSFSHLIILWWCPSSLFKKPQMICYEDKTKYHYMKARVLNLCSMKLQVYLIVTLGRAVSWNKDIKIQKVNLQKVNPDSSSAI